MRLGEKLKYKARKYLYQLDQDNYYNKRKMEKDLQESENTYTYDKSYAKEEKNYSYGTQHYEEDDYYNVYPYQKNYYSNQYQETYQEPYQKEKFYNQTDSISKKNITETFNDMEEYLEEKLNGFKKRK